MKVLFILGILFLSGCNSDSGKKDTLDNSDFKLTYDYQLSISESDSLILRNSRKSDEFTDFSDSTNSIIQVSGDTLKLLLSTGWYEGSYDLDLKIYNDTVYSTFELFDNYSKYDYVPQQCLVNLNKNKFRVGEYLIANIDYITIGKLRSRPLQAVDTAVFKGKIKLKIRDANFTYGAFYVENNRNEFYASLKQRPDTIKKLNLYGCAFTELPSEISLFTSLEELDLNGNDLSKATFDKLSELKTLKSLDLTECNLSKFPTQILALSKLKILNIWNNKISYIPDGLYNLTSLTELTIGNNNLSYLSPKISNLINLKLLETSSTAIRVYPDEMIKLKNLAELYPSDTMYYIPKSLIKYAWGYDTILSK